MYMLKSESLTVHVLDPVADKDKLGTRYCTAGFIFQVDDAARGPLMSGPTYPASYNLFDGQGIPDAFQPHPVLSEDADGSPVLALGIGIGIIDQKANTVIERTSWKVTRGDGEIQFQTAQAGPNGQLSFTLERRVTLRGRTIRSETSMTNTGKRHVPFQWYPHPFFPLYPTGECCRMSVPTTLPENAGYEVAPSGFLRMKHLPWKREINENYFQLVGHPGDRPVSFVQKHPLTSLVTAATDYVPTRLPVWGNGFTFSFEPYYERTLSQAETARWAMTYDF
jgi:hypothetical protein